MPQSVELSALPAALRSTLSRAVGEANLSEISLVSSCAPIVLMMRGHALEAFAVGEESDYLPLYTAFKKYFMAQGATWATKDVSFIFCLPAGHSASEEFCSKVEVDVYFCRKYVVQLQQDIANSLARLPFLPLVPIGGGSIRPPSAQALLRSRSVKTELANRLVVQGTGAQTILQACIDARYGEPSAFEGGRADALQAVTEEPRSQSVLRSISIENFRAYRTKKEFPLGSAVTVLYGPNGFGKTSFFDAVDFVVTGGVGRLAKSSAGLAKAAKHLDCGEEPTKVSLTFEREGVSHTIVRDLSDPNKATLDGKAADRKEILALLTGGEPIASDRVENLVSLFRATHLFSQDRQELTGRVAENCELPAEIVSRMLAFDDYVIGLKKAKEVLDLAKQQVDDAESRLQAARKQAKTEEIELTRLQGIQSAGGTAETLEARATELEQAIKQAGFSLAELGEEREPRAMRALLGVRGAEAASRRSILEKSLETLATLQAIQGELKTHQIQLADYAVAMEAADAAHRASEEKLQQANADLARLRASEVEGRTTRDAIAWVISVRPEFDRLSAEAIELKAKLDQATAQRVHQRTMHTDAVSALTTARDMLTKAEMANRAARELGVRIRAAQDGLAQGLTLGTLIAEAQAEEKTLSLALTELQAKHDEAHQAVLAQQQVVEGAQRDLAAGRRNASEVQDLAAAFRSHVVDGNCLLCGHDHGSAESLLAAIDQRFEKNEALLRISEVLSQEITKRDKLDAARQNLADQMQQQEQRRGQRAAQRADFERKRDEFRAVLAAIGLENSSDLLQQVSKQTIEAEVIERQTTESLEVAKQVQRNADAAVRASAEAESSAAGQEETISKSLEDCQKRLSALAGDQRRGAFDVAAELPILERALAEVNARMSAVGEAVQQASELADGSRTEFAALHAHATAARSSHQNAMRQSGLLEGRIQSLSASLSSAGLGPEATSDEVLRGIEEAVARQESAKALTNRVAEFEISRDAAATSAAFESIRKRLSDCHQVAELNQTRLAQLTPWVKYFEGVHKLLERQQATATQHFTHDYGPRTAVIQRRLRPVYGFGDIEVTSKGSSIAVHVKRNDEDLRPTDYFSQSQIQTLVLGLFLTACSSQTWSGFSSIMMDDPVTHFDDLNTYALLDLIAGLQSSPEGNKQFVISTCDEKLLQLARQKFRHLGDAAKFYSFSAIGAIGPKVAEIPA